MYGGKNTHGYTILEVMIFLAVSGLMFLLAAVFISGKQASAEFKQGMNSVNDEVRRVINDVSNGFYPSNNGFPCQAATTGSPQFIGTAAEQGGNQGCVFLGKIMQFKADNKPSDYNIFSIAGRQNAGGSNSSAPTSFSEAQPKTITSPVDLTESKALEWGLEVTGMYNGPVNPSNAIGAIGFFGSFNSDAQGSSQTVTTAAIPGSTLGQSKTVMISTIDSSGEPTALDAASNNADITICFTNGGSKFGSLKIGSNNGQRLSTNILFGTNATEVGC